jgi:hypothetical protein
LVVQLRVKFVVSQDCRSASASATPGGLQIARALLASWRQTLGGSKPSRLDAAVEKLVVPSVIPRA